MTMTVKLHFLVQKRRKDQFELDQQSVAASQRIQY